MNDKEYEKRFDKWTNTLNKKQHLEFLELEIKRGEILSQAIKEAKQEVFDDIAKMPLYAVTKGKKIRYVDVGEADWFKELKKRHLSTFPKEKEHNYRKPSIHNHNGKKMCILW